MFATIHVVRDTGLVMIFIKRSKTKTTGEIDH